MEREAALKAMTVGWYTVVEMDTHQLPRESGVTSESRYQRRCHSDEQVYQRTITLDEKWRPLDTGWVKEPALVKISNEEGIYWQVVPTQEEREEVETHVIEICFLPADVLERSPERPPPDIEVPPAESSRFCPGCPERISIRCRSGLAKAKIFVVPK